MASLGKYIHPNQGHMDAEMAREAERHGFEAESGRY